MPRPMPSDPSTGSVHRIERDRRPLYLQTVEAIGQLIEVEGLKIGATLPGELELASMLDVGRGTVREAMMHLENASVVARRRGVGTVLIGLMHQPALGLDRLEPLEDLAERQGWVCGTADVEIEATALDDRIAVRLDLPVGSAATAVTRTKTRDGEALAVMESWVPEHVLDHTTLTDTFSDSLTGLVLAQFHLLFARAAVSAISCPERYLERLALNAGAPVLVLEETFISDGENPLAYNESFFIPERISLELLRKPTRQPGH